MSVSPARPARKAYIYAAAAARFTRTGFIGAVAHKTVLLASPRAWTARSLWLLLVFLTMVAAAVRSMSTESSAVPLEPALSDCGDELKRGSTSGLPPQV